MSPSMETKKATHQVVKKKFNTPAVFTIDRRAPLVARKEIEIYAPPQKVWALMSNINGWPRWNSAVSWTNAPSTLGIGSVFQWKSNGLKITSTIRLYEMRKSIGWTGETIGATVSHAWHLEMTKAGVRVVTEESMSGWAIKLFKPLMQVLLSSSLRKWLRDLKKEAEKI